jgi:hypothetical protein
VEDDLDFYTVIYLDRNSIKLSKAGKSGKFYYPAVAVYGIFAQ